MRWAVAFLPCHIRQLMNLLASFELYRGSGLRVSALAVRLRAMGVTCSCLLRCRCRPTAENGTAVDQFTEGSGTERGPWKGATAWIRPLGSKYSWLTPEHAGQGTFTAATVRVPAASPLPEHLSVTLIDWPQAQQLKSKITCRSIIAYGPLW